MKNNNGSGSEGSNIIQLFTRTPWQAQCDEQIVRLSPEVDGLEMLYSNDSSSEQMFGMKILCWSIDRKGEVDAMVPWLGKLQPCRKLADPLNGHWEGYFDSTRHNLFYEAPDHKISELENASRYFSNTCDQEGVVQEIPDTIGTHAVFSSDGLKSMTLMQVVSWRLLGCGTVQAMVADMDRVTLTPVLPGDDCLQPVDEMEGFKYFFHHAIANKLKKGDESIMDAFSKLLEL